MKKRSDELGPELEPSPKPESRARQRQRQRTLRDARVDALKGDVDAIAYEAAFKRYSIVAAALIQRGEVDE